MIMILLEELKLNWPGQTSVYAPHHIVVPLIIVLGTVNSELHSLSGQLDNTTILWSFLSNILSALLSEDRIWVWLSWILLTSTNHDI